MQEHISRGFTGSRGFEILPDGKIFKDAFTGRRDERPGLKEAFDYIRANPGKVNYFVFRGIDRFTRGGSYSYEHIKRELAQYGVTMIDTHGVIQPVKNTLEHVGFEYEWSKTSPSEIAEIVLANAAKAEVTNILTRMIGREIELTLQGFKIRGAVDGFLNKKIYVENKKRVIQVPNPERAHYYVEIFTLRAAGALTDKEIVDRLNTRGFRTPLRNRWDRLHQRIIGNVGGLPLTVKLLQEAICRPIYCGVMCEKWTRWKPIKAQYDGLVSIDTFNRANRGKVFVKENPAGMEILYDYQPEKTMKQKTRQNPLFPYKNVVLCPHCKKPFTGSCPRGKSGHRFPTYHCSRKHKYFGISKSEFDEAVDNFVRRLKFRAGVFDIICKDWLEKHHLRKQELAQASHDAHRMIADLRSEQKAKSQAFVLTTSPVLRVGLEKEIEDLEVMIKMAGGESQKIDISTTDIERFRDYGISFLEHLPELLLNPENPRLQVTLFSLIFREFPTFDEIEFGTPKLTWIFELSSASVTAESVAVRLAGLSWNEIATTVKKCLLVFEEIELWNATRTLDKLVA